MTKITDKRIRERTLGGHRFEIFCERDGLLYGRILGEEGWIATKWNLDGADADGLSFADLVENTDPVEAVIFLLEGPAGVFYPSLTRASASGLDAVASSKIVFNIGEFYRP